MCTLHPWLRTTYVGGNRYQLGTLMVQGGSDYMVRAHVFLGWARFWMTVGSHRAGLWRNLADLIDYQDSVEGTLGHR